MKAYKDLNMINPTQAPTVNTFDALFQAILVLVTMRPYQLPFSRVGVDLEDELFEFVDDAGALDLLNKISRAVDLYLPAIKLSFGRSNIRALPNDNAYELDLKYTIPNVSSEEFSFTGTLGQDGEIS